MSILRSTAARIAAVAVAVVLLAVGGFTFWQVRSDSDEAPLYMDSAERQAYEMALKESPHRATADFAVYIKEDGRVHATDPTNRIGFCEYRCATVVTVQGGYHVTLPVSFSYQPGSQSFSEPFDRFRVLQLTFWDSALHQPRTVTAPANGTVTLPEVLYKRSVEDVKEGETAYTTPDFIRQTATGPVVLSEVFANREPGGDHYGLVEMARLTRTGEGFDVCLPASYGELIEEDGANGIPARIAPVRC